MKILIKKILTIVIILLLVLTIGYLFLSNPGKGKDEQKERYNVNLENTSVVFPVKVMKVEKRTFIRWIKGNGIVKSSQEAEIIPQLSGRIVNSFIREGIIVPKNGVLIELDDREYKIALAKANNELMKSQFDYLVLKTGTGEAGPLTMNSKIENLFKKCQEALGKYEKNEAEFDAYLEIRNQYELAILSTGAKKDSALQSRSGLLSALNDLKKAELDYSYTKLKAPFAGAVADYDLSIGGYVTSGKTVCRIVDISTLKVVVGVLESDVKMLSAGRSADVIIPALGEEKYKGKIISISPVIDPDKKTCKVEIELPNRGDGSTGKASTYRIKPGMYANCVIEGDVFPDRLLIPKKALLVRNDRKLVFTVLEEKAQWVYVTTGMENEDWIEILSGLNLGDVLIIDGHYTLSHNASVRVE